MYQSISIDENMIIIKTDKASDVSELLEFISRSDKKSNIDAFLNFAAQNRVIEKGYKFNRDDCYER